MKIIIFALFLTTLAHADELRLSAQEARKLGYVPVKLTRASSLQKRAPLSKHGLPWPVEFHSTAFTLGNSMSQYQNYGGSPYWHGGDDLRTAQNAWVTTPVSGTLAGGHYSYVDQPDGSMVKQMLPWPRVGQSLYFEISITTADGTRFELHHVDRDSLTPQVLELLNRGGGTIAAGTRIGRVIYWPMEKPAGTNYHHIHYNIIAPGNKELNPEWFSPLIPDTTAPALHGVYARYGQRFERILENARLNTRPDELIVASTDVKDGNSYVQPTDYIALSAMGRTHVLWDMRERLLTPAQKYPDIRVVLQSSLRTADERLRTQGDYSGDFFLMRVSLPDGSLGDSELTLKDQAGNATSFRLSLP